MKKSLFTMALVAAGAVIYFLSKDKEEEKSETPEIRLIDLKNDNSESESHDNSSEDLQEVQEEVASQENEVEAEKEESVKTEEEHFSDLMNELEEEFTKDENEENQDEEKQEEMMPSYESEMEEVEEENPSFAEESKEMEQSEPVQEESVMEQTDESVSEEETVVEKADEEDPSEEKEPESQSTDEENASVVEDLKGKILNEIEQEVKEVNDFKRKGTFNKETPYSETVYEISDLYPYLSYEMIDKVLEANIGFNHVYRENQPIKIIHRVGFDKIEDLIEFVILIKEHDYRVEENNGLDMISISKDLMVEDMIIISDIFNVSNQVYRLHGHYQGYEIVEQ